MYDSKFCWRREGRSVRGLSTTTDLPWDHVGGPWPPDWRWGGEGARGGNTDNSQKNRTTKVAS